MKNNNSKVSIFRNSPSSEINFITSARLRYKELKTINQFRLKYMKKLTNKSQKLNLLELNSITNNKKPLSYNSNCHKLPKIKSLDSIFQDQTQKTKENLFLKFLKNIPSINIENINSQSISTNSVKNYIFYRTANSVSDSNFSKVNTTNTTSFNLNNNKSLEKNLSSSKLNEKNIIHSNSNPDILNKISSVNNPINNNSNKTIKNKNNDEFYYNIYNNYYRSNIVEDLFNKPFQREILQEFILKSRYIRGMKYSINEKAHTLKLLQKSIQNQIQLRKRNHIKLLNSIKSSEDYGAKLKLYLDFLRRIIEKESIKVLILKDKKYSLINENFQLRHKINKLKWTYQSYLYDKYFLLSVKNHSIDFNTFKEEDKNGYLNDVYKLQIFDLVLNKIFEDADDEIVSTGELNTNSNKNLEINNIIDDKISQMKKDIRDNKNEKISSKSTNKKIGRKHIYIPRFKCGEILDTPEEFNQDLNLISNNIKKSLEIYNEMQRQIQKNQQILKDMEQNEKENKYLFYFEKKLKNVRKVLNNLKKNNRLLKNKIYYFKNSNVIEKENLNAIVLKNKLNVKLKKIINNIMKSGDKQLIDYLFGDDDEEVGKKIKNMKCIDILFIIEKGFVFLEKYCNQIKNGENEKY